MNANASKSNENLEFFNSRLDEIRMSGHERLRAKARFAQAEALADALATTTRAIERLFRGLVKRLSAKPGRPIAPSAG